MEIEYYLIQGKKKIRKYKPVKTKDSKIALKAFKEWFKKAYSYSSYELIIVY